MSRKLSAGAKQALVLLVISGGILSCFLVVSGAENQLSLLRPRWNVPALKLANETIEIDAQTDFPLASVSDFNATLQSPFGNFPLTIQPVSQSGASIHVVASFPSSVIPDVLYDLKISVGGMQDVQRHAVKVLSAYKSEFTFIVWCDTQVGYSQDYEENWIRTYDLVNAMVDAANVLSPEFIILCGDITESAMKSEYQFMYEQCMRLNVPIFIGPGNHDYFGTAEYQRWCQYTNFTFDYGPNYHFDYIDTGMNLDAFRDQYFNWLAADLAAHSSSAVKIVGGHAPPYQCNPGTGGQAFNKNFENHQQDFVSLLDANNVTAYIYGHDHKDKINYGNCTVIPANSTTKKTWFIQTSSGREDGGFRVIHFKNKQMLDVTSLVNASTGQRSQNASFIALPRWTDMKKPQPDYIPYLETTVNASRANDLSAEPVHAIVCNVTNRFSQETFVNMTVSLNILSSSPLIKTNLASVKIVKRTDMQNAYTVKFDFTLGPKSSILLNATGVS